MRENRKIGERIANARKKAGLTQEELADRIGRKSVSVSQWERDKRRPKIENIIQIAEALNVSPQELLGLDSDERSKKISCAQKICPFNRLNCMSEDCTLWCEETLTCSLRAMAAVMCEKKLVTTCKMCINYISTRKKTTGELCGICAKLHLTLDTQDVIHECDDYNERGV